MHRGAAGRLRPEQPFQAGREGQQRGQDNPAHMDQAQEEGLLGGGAIQSC